MMNSIFNITSQLLEVYELAQGGEFDPEAIQSAIESIEMALEDKADNYAALIRMIDGDNAAIDKEMERLRAHKASRTRLKDSLKNNLLSVMKTLERPKIKTQFNSFSIRKNPPSVAITDEAEIPEVFFITPAPVVSKSAILEALKRGEEVPGAQLAQGESLSIR